MARWIKVAPLTGVVFVGLMVAAFALGGGSPGSGATGQHVINFYRAHKGSQQASAFLVLYGMSFFLFFAANLRSFFRSSLPGSSLPSLSFGGAVFTAVGAALLGSLGFALADVPKKLSPGAAQALNVVSNDLFFPLLAGTCVFMIANGFATLRSRGLPVWLGWIAIVIGVIAVTPIGFIGFLALLGWTLVVSVLLTLRNREATAAAVPRPSETMR